jgi:hypothetical protein
MDPIPLIRAALRGTGLDLVASCSIEEYDARAPATLASPLLMPRARGLVVVGSAGRGLWEAARARSGAAWTPAADPLDTHVARSLDLADLALARARIGTRRFEARVASHPASSAAPQLDFRALGELVGLGSPGPFGMLIHPDHGPWWALRAAYFVDTEVAPALEHTAPCAGCEAPCVRPDASGRAGPGLSMIDEPTTAVRRTLLAATPEVRTRCVVGTSSRYSSEQIAYHTAVLDAHMRDGAVSPTPLTFPVRAKPVELPRRLRRA